jgi:hypothetical protein
MYSNKQTKTLLGVFEVPKYLKIVILENHSCIWVYMTIHNIYLYVYIYFLIFLIRGNARKHGKTIKFTKSFALQEG